VFGRFRTGQTAFRLLRDARISNAISAWLHGAGVYDRSIDVLILRLRRKMQTDPTQPEHIKTERAAGDVFDVPVAVPR